MRKIGKRLCVLDIVFYGSSILVAVLNSVFTLEDEIRNYNHTIM